MIMRDVNYGWLIRYLHANTASFFFIFVYLHIGRGLYYGSYKSPRILLWSIGVVILILMMAIAFLGYVFSLKCDMCFNDSLCFPISTFSMSMVIASTSSNSLQTILNEHTIKPVHIIEMQSSDRIDTKNESSVKKLLNSFAGIYICINKVNGHMYVGSAGKSLMYRRYRGHIHLAKGGSVLVNRAINKYGIKNFAFIVVEVVPEEYTLNKDYILKLEQKYLDQLLPIYNIAKVAGSV